MIRVFWKNNMNNMIKLNSMNLKTYHTMKTTIITTGVCLLLFGCITGCDNYQRLTDATPGITVNSKSLTLFVNDTVQLKASPTDLTFSWESEDSEIAVVNASGLVEAVGEGSTNIVVSSDDILSKVAVKAVKRIPLLDVLLNEEYVELKVNGTFKVLATLVPLDANDAGKSSWRSEDQQIATVDTDGNITAIDEGVTCIFYQIGDFTKTITVNVVGEILCNMSNWVFLQGSDGSQWEVGPGQNLLIDDETFWHYDWPNSIKYPFLGVIDIKEPTKVYKIAIQKMEGFNNTNFTMEYYLGNSSNPNATWTLVAKGNTWGPRDG
jgi:hypothetical protein